MVVTALREAISYSMPSAPYIVNLCRALHGPDGMFIVDNINEWQHSAMYLAFLISGVVDLVGFYAPKGTLPPGTEQVSALSFPRSTRTACSS